MGTVVESQQPIFRWGELDGATSYVVNVYDVDYNEVARSPSLTSTEWKMPKSISLERGKVYIWQVTALRDRNEIVSPKPPAPEAKFQVLEQANLDNLQDTRAKYPEFPLVLAILYAQAGLLEDAEQELERLLDDNPQSTVVQSLLHSLRRSRQ